MFCIPIHIPWQSKQTTHCNSRLVYVTMMWFCCEHTRTNSHKWTFVRQFEKFECCFRSSNYDQKTPLYLSLFHPSPSLALLLKHNASSTHEHWHSQQKVKLKSKNFRLASIFSIDTFLLRIIAECWWQMACAYTHEDHTSDYIVKIECVHW